MEMQVMNALAGVIAAVGHHAEAVFRALRCHNTKIISVHSERYTRIFLYIFLYLFLFLRHIGLPLAVLGILTLLKVSGLSMSKTVFTVITLLSATPAATSATMFAEKYDCDANYVSRLVTVSTLISIVTMPLILLLV